MSSVGNSSAALFFSTIILSISVRCVLILPLNSAVLLRSSSFDNDWYCAKKPLTFATIGVIFLTSFSLLLPPNNFEINPIIFSTYGYTIIFKIFIYLSNTMLLLFYRQIDRAQR